MGPTAARGRQGLCVAPGLGTWLSATAPGVTIVTPGLRISGPGA